MPASRVNETLVLVCLLAAVAIINFCTMPGEFYTGDAYAIKLEAVHWIRNGKFGFSGSDTEKIADYVAIPDQFYKFNSDTNSYHNRWGLFNLLVSSLPEVMNADRQEYLYTGIMQLDRHTLYWHNLFNCLLSVILTLVLYKTVSLYTKNPVFRIFFVISVLYCSFAWYYMRAQSYELLHLVLFSVFYYRFTVFLRSLALNRSFLRTTGFVGYNLLLALLCLSKPFYFIIYPVLFITVCVRHRSINSSTTPELVPGYKDLAAIILPGVITLLLVLLAAQAYYGNLFLGHLLADPHSEQIAFSYRHIPERLYDYLLSRNRSLFIHMPALILAVLGFRQFMRNYRAESVFLIMLLMLALIFFSCAYTVGEWCYGPRFFLFLLPVLCLPSVIFLEQVQQRTNHILPGLVTIGAAIIFSASCVTQTIVNSRPFHTRYTLELGLANMLDLTDETREYFESEHFAIINRDLNRILAGEYRGFLATNLMSYVPEESIQFEFGALSALLAEKYPLNYYFRRR